MTKLIQLAYSGGKASEAILWMVLRGEIVPEAKLIVTCANPGMEHPLTHVHTQAMEVRCKAAGIPFLRTHENLYEGLIGAKASGRTRFDFPAFFTKNKTTGKIGKMTQRCTKEYKIAPMDRLARHWMDANLGISKKSKRIGEKILCKWIGFSWDEVHRIREHECAKYVCFDYPLANRKITNPMLLDYYAKNNLVCPPRSVCSGCFANDAAYFKELHDNWPTAWAQAVAVDESIRDLSQFGMQDECYVHASCVPLTELAKAGFPEKKKKDDNQTCFTGHCFI